MKKANKFILNKKYDLTLYIIAIAITMLGLSYMSVPLYQLFCQTYGIGGTIQKSNLELNKLDTFKKTTSQPINNSELLGETNTNTDNKLNTLEHTNSNSNSNSQKPNFLHSLEKNSINSEYTQKNTLKSINVNLSADISNDLP